MILLISDIHLSPNYPKITEAFIEFLRIKAVKADKLFILGDLFDYWLGDDAITSFELDIAKHLTDLAQMGTKIYFMPGNRDFLIGNKFCNLAKCQLIDDPYILDFNQHQILLTHGDILCTKDVGYLRMRKILRSKLGLTILKNIPLKLRRKLAQILRTQSTKRTRYKEPHITDVTDLAVINLMQKFNVNTLIHGHTHRPKMHNWVIANKNMQRMVLGDWRPNTYYVEITKEYPIKLLPFCNIN